MKINFHNQDAYEFKIPTIMLVLAKKPSVAQTQARVLGANKRCDGYLEGNGYLVSWCIGHLV